MTFLNVPYAEKDEARALGARWNPGKKRWYAPPGVALDAFQKWMPAGDAPAGDPDKPGGGRRDSAVAKLAVGVNYVELAHDCNPFAPCAVCAEVLAGGRWIEAQSALAGMLAGLKR